MKAIKVMATVDEEGKLALDKPLTIDKNSRVEVIVLIQETGDIDEYPDKTKTTIREYFRQVWHEAMTGKTIPVSQIWEGIDDVKEQLGIFKSRGFHHGRGAKTK